MAQFRFYIEHKDDYGDAPDQDAWTVSMPHQCDSWHITPDGSRYDGVTHAQAVADLQAFIAAAQDALARLLEKQADA